MDLRHEKTKLQHQDKVAQMRRDSHSLPDGADTQRIAQKARRTQVWERFGEFFLRHRPN